MKAIILLVPALLLVGCAGGEVVRPWECTAATEPVDAYVNRVENGKYVYDCRWNGEGGTNGSEGDAE